jgi:leucyl-tRNA synthetase
MNKFDFQTIEKKWRKRWEDEGIYHTDLSDKSREKFYNLMMFPYPSGDKLHIGHVYNYSGADTFGRFKLMQNKNVFEPIGYDAFGLPAENYAIKNNVHPAMSTKENIDYMHEQLKNLGCMYDWTREINTSDPNYYKWTQWLFLILYKAGLAKRKKAPVNWCPSCKTVLANEQVINGACERCESQVVQKNIKQWFFEITKYAEKLLEGLDKIDWPKRTILMQKNWIGKSEGVEIDFKIDGVNEKIKVFTTRPDTLWGATYMVLAPEHPLVSKIVNDNQRSEVKKYIEDSRHKTELERLAIEKEKTGVFTGSYAINPANNKKIPIWIADYVMLSYGTGAIMAVPAHDERDFAFAKKNDLPIVEVISPDGKKHPDLKKAYINQGVMINSDEFSGKYSQDANKEIIKWLEKKDIGQAKIQYKLRDWLISRQRYWGAPIPIIFCDKCGEVPVPEKDLPVKLPKLDDFKPADDGQSPLAKVSDFVNVKCPKCGEDAKRSTETMDTFVCSTWYYLRYLSPDLDTAAFDKNLAKKWLPVNQYCGGAEHAVMHLLYARFIAKVLNDRNLIDFDEPFIKLNHQGIILAEDGSKMSKSKGNVVIPDEYFKKFGVDTFRLYVLFLAPFEQGSNWNDKGILGAKRFLDKLWNYQNQIIDSEPKKESLKIAHRTIKKVSEDYQNFHFNTAIAMMMEYLNFLLKTGEKSKKLYEILIKILSPICPYICEEIWETLYNKKSIFLSGWPKFDPSLAKADKVIIAVQINGKLRDTILIESNTSEKEVTQKTLALPKVKKYLGGKNPQKTIYVPGQIINFVI